MTEQEIITWLQSLPGVVVATADARSGAPEIAWADSFIYDEASAALPADRRWPFATVVTTDYRGFDAHLKRESVFRVNLNVGRDHRTGRRYPPSEHKQRPRTVDPAREDVIIAHPQYGQQGWVAVVSPGTSTSTQLRDLLRETHARAATHP